MVSCFSSQFIKPTTHIKADPESRKQGDSNHVVRGEQEIMKARRKREKPGSRYQDGSTQYNPPRSERAIASLIHIKHLV